MLLDTRGPRFGAWVTTAVLSGVLAVAVVAPTVAGWLALAQAAVFAVGAISARHAPYGVIFRLLVASRLGPPAELEPAGPVRFAQGVGFGFAAAAAISLLAGATVVGVVFAAFALVAAFLNAAFGLCLACKVYPFISLYVIRRKPLVRRNPQGANS
jgi:hypothetical protein